jgi:hypothetical protein
MSSTDTKGTAPELPLLLGAGGESAESLLLIGARDASGMVAVRRWSADDWSAMPHPVAERADALLKWIEAQAEAGRSMNQSLYAVRLWLRGAGAASERR